jgi:hypothetical protein
MLIHGTGKLQPICFPLGLLWGFNINSEHEKNVAGCWLFVTGWVVFGQSITQNYKKHFSDLKAIAS